MNAIFEKLTRKQIRYILFRIKGAISQERFYSRSNGRLPLRVVMLKKDIVPKKDEDPVEIKPPFGEGEFPKLLKHWKIDADAKKADELVDFIENHYSKQDHFSGFEKFSEPNGVFDAWDIGVPEDDLLTKKTRPEKSWLFDKPVTELVLRGLRQDRESALETETGATKQKTSVTMPPAAAEREIAEEKKVEDAKIAEAEEVKRLAAEPTEIEVEVK